MNTQYEDSSSPNDLSEKLAHLLTLLISFQKKLQVHKQRLCMLQQFHPQYYYNQIDTEHKGFIDIDDIRIFVHRQKQTFHMDEQTLLQLCKHYNQPTDNKNSHVLYYWGYLKLVKPFFNDLLAREMLRREAPKNVQVSPQVRAELVELLCLSYVLVAEHEDLLALIHSQYFFSPVQVGRLLFASGKPNGEAIFEFVAGNSEYEVQREEIKYLSAYFNCHEHMLNSQHVLSALIRPRTQPTSQSAQEVQPETKTVSNFKKTDFLHYRHPNSEKYQPTRELPPIQTTTNILSNFLYESKVKREIIKQESSRGMKEPTIRVMEVSQPPPSTRVQNHSVRKYLQEKRQNKSEYIESMKGSGILQNFML